MVEYWQKHADAQGSLEAWYNLTREANWKNPQDVKDSFRNASFIGDNRVIFNIKGSDYRLIVHIRYEAGIVYIKWVGTHDEYDRIDAEDVGRE